MPSSDRVHACTPAPLLRHPCLLPFAALAGVVGAQWIALGPDPARWDPLLVAGTLCFSATLALAAGLPEKTERALLRAAASFLPPAVLAAVSRRRERHARRLGWITGAVLGAAALLGSIDAMWPSDLWELSAVSSLCALGGWVAGNRLGALIASGPLGWLVDDAVSGVGRRRGQRAQIVGELFGLQTALMTIPVVYLGTCAVWLHTGVAIGYGHWTGCFTGLFAVSLLVELVCFLLPLLAFATQLWRPVRGAGG
jgi:hypothetical protein